MNLGHCVKSYGHFCQMLALFTMSTHQIWSCHMTQDANFRNVLFCPNSTFNMRKSHKIYSGKALYFRSYRRKPLRVMGGKHPPPPSAFRVKTMKHIEAQFKTAKHVGWLLMIFRISQIILHSSINQHKKFMTSKYQNEALINNKG